MYHIHNTEDDPVQWLQDPTGLRPFPLKRASISKSSNTPFSPPLTGLPSGPLRVALLTQRSHSHKKHGCHPSWVLGVELCSPKKKRYVEVLTPRTPECDLIWRQGLHRGNHVKVTSLGWALIQQDWCSYKGKFGHRNRCAQGRDHVNMKAETRVLHL